MSTLPADIAEYERCNPLRRLDWRFAAIKKAHGHKQPRPKTKDQFIRVYARFIQLMLMGCLQHPAGQGFLKRWPFLPDVHRLASDVSARSHLEAWLLTQAPDEEIASRVGIAPEVVHWYEKVHFNVRDRFQASDWLVKTVGISMFSMSQAKGDRLEDLGRKWAAYQGGRHALIHLTSGMQGAPKTPAEVIPFLDKFVRRDISIAAFRSLLTLDLADPQVLGLHMRLISHLRTTASKRAQEKQDSEKLVSEKLAKGVEVMLKSMEGVMSKIAPVADAAEQA